MLLQDLLEESSEHFSLDDKNLNFVIYVKRTKENFEKISKYVKLQIYSKHMKRIIT